MPRVEAKGKRGKSAARKPRARSDNGAEEQAGGSGVLLDVVILFSLALSLLSFVAVFMPTFVQPIGPLLHDYLYRYLGLGMYLVPLALVLVPAVVWRTSWHRTWLRAWAWAWCLMLLSSLGGGLFVNSGLGGILGDSVATLGYAYLDWFYPVLLAIVALVVLARLAGRSFVRLIGLGAYRAAVNTGAAVADYSQAVREEAQGRSELRRQRAGERAEQERAHREEQEARREAILTAELEAADAPEGETPVIRDGMAVDGEVGSMESAAREIDIARSDMLAEIEQMDGAELAPEVSPEENNEAAGEIADGAGPAERDEFAAVVDAAYPEGVPTGDSSYGTSSGDEGDLAFAVDADGQLKLFASTQSGYELPPLSLLMDAPLHTGEEQYLSRRAAIIERTMRSFHIEAQCIGSEIGPRVTRFELKIGPGINVSKVVGLSDNLALELAVKAVRIEAPIPGRSAVGIEVPNAAPELVTLKSILESPLNQQSNHPLTVGLGRDIAGQSVVANLAKMPHVLVAGATGSGKSVCLNALIVSLLTRNAPDTLRFILIDPKRVEMTTYQELPHLACPVVHDVNQAQSALKWAVAEMERRYRMLEQARARNIAAYNRQAEPEERLPFIVVVIDELADLMLMAGQVIEKLVTRIAQLSRAVGIHLIIATQRPDVKVITGTIKANIPSRIAFATVSYIDSRTILDGNGAEKLLGEGDMLFAPIGENVPIRVQGAYLADPEIERVVEWCRGQAAASYDDSITRFEFEEGGAAPGEAGGRDPKFPEAQEIVIATQRASTSFLQRRLKIGYNRAARIMEELEDAGLVSPPDGTGNRKVL